MTHANNYLSRCLGFLLPFLFVGSAAGFTCTERTNVALSANGATASASSQFSTNYPAFSTINGDRRGLNWNNGGGWNDSTASTHPDWLQIDFNGSKTIDEINVITLQDNPATPAEPTESMTFTLYGLTGYSVQYWNGSAWTTVTGGTVSGNNKVWKKFTFTAITTTKIRVLTSSSPDAYSRITEVEAWGNDSQPARTNFALGGTTSASSQFSSNYPSFSTINGDRRGLNWNTGGGWNDSTVNTHPDWLQIDFNGSKTIDEINVITLQDNAATPAEPTESMTFTLYGLTGYSVQYWNGSAWTTVSGGTVTGNNKIWRKFTFTAITTTKIRVLTSSSPDAYSRITELEAWGPQASSCQPIARLDPLNATGGGGENPLSQNFNWSVPLVSLPGRAGLDLNLGLSYNSLVWTKSGSSISFNDDNGFPSAGFRLGFPLIQQLHYNGETGKYGFVLIGPDGGRTELRQVGTSALFEAADSSHLLLDTTDMTLRATDGAQLSYLLMGNQFNCTKIKDRNGNYISIQYISGRVDKVIDTLGREIKFNYDGTGLLTSITQTWNQGQPSQTEHPWAEFTYADTTIQTDFPGLTVYGPANNTTIKTLSKVTLPDDSHFDFSYTNWGQVWKIAYIAPDNVNHVLNYRAYKLPGSPLLATSQQVDCPRFTERRDWVKYWNGDTDGTMASNEEAITSFSGPSPASWTMPGDSQSTNGTRTEVTLPDGTVNKIYFVGAAGTQSGWSRGLPALVETLSGGSWQRKVKTTWTQDNTSVSYPLNPRVLESNIYDPSGNRARTQIDYQQFTFSNGTNCWLPRDFFEYQADASTVLRTTRTNYNTNTAYSDRRILGLPSEKLLYEGNVNGSNPPLKAKLEFVYDESAGFVGTEVPTVQHDATGYSGQFVGRANLTKMIRHSVSSAESTSPSIKYNRAGGIVSTKDASNQEIQISNADAFSDNTNRNTFAYASTVTDPDGYSATSKYNFDFGSVTYRRTPQPNQSNNVLGPEQTFAYDSIGRLQQVNHLVNNAYKRLEYTASQLRVDTYTTVQEGLGEARAFEITDGAGRVIATASQLPNSAGGYSGQRTIYDVMGRTFKSSNPTETSASGTPFQWTATGDDVAAGWRYTEQTYDWKGRPLRTTHPDTTYKEAAYNGCGCAGGQVTTLTDEGTIDGGVEKRRQTKTYSDVLGRTVKTEVLKWSGGSVYSATVNTYNVRDQLEQITEYAGPVGGGTTSQTTSMTYDGYGRFSSRHVPQQDDATATVWTYNADDTVNTITDARGAVRTNTYNARHLITGVSYSAPSSIAVPAAVSYTYDAAGNRMTMTDGMGSVTYVHDALSRLTSETRAFTGLGNFTLSYSYNLSGQLTSITDPFSAQISYTHDVVGRVTAVTGSNFGSVSNYASSVQYRAWGAVKSLSYGNSKTLGLTYNANLQASSYEVSGVMKKAYTYYNDGKLKFTQDQLTANSKFDRLYRYDHVGRSTIALSGLEAREQGTTDDRPYNETMTYDALGHLTSREVRQWDRQDLSLDTYSNDRRIGWNYDPDGRELVGANQSTYDAAGQITRFGFADPHETDQQFDGDGERAKTTLKTYDPSNGQLLI